MRDQTVNPILVEIIRNAFNSAAEEMNAAMFRSAYSPIIYEMKDCSVGIFDKEARLLGQAAGLPIFLGNLETCIRLVTEQIGYDGYRDGDVFIMNDSYLQGTHLTDITVFSPIFYDDELIGFAATRADGGHIGGKNLGLSTDCSNIFQEGVRIPPIRLAQNWKINEDILDLLSLNSFLHQARRGDISSQVSACHKGNQRLQELYAKFGKETIEKAAEEIFRQSEELDKAAVSEIPDGTYKAEGIIDNDGLGTENIPIKVKVIIEGDQMTVDLSESSGPTQGSLNCGIAQAISGCRVAFKELINPEVDVTGGNFKNLHVVVPESSIFNAKEPSPCSWYFTPIGIMIDLIIKALSSVVPDRAAGAHFGDSMVVSFAGVDPRTGKAYGLTDVTVGGWGGFRAGDGESCVYNAVNGDFKNMPVEALENRYPIRVLSYQMRPDSEGAGKRRGGFGGIRELQALADSSFACWLDRSKMPAWGIEGGQSAKPPIVTLNPGKADEKKFNKITDLHIKKGDVIRIETGGGGGYGDPKDRDSEAVREDVENGLLSRERAKAVYGKEI